MFERTDAITWQEYFMGVAKLSAMRSKDPVTQVGACIVGGNNRIISLGYNGMPIGCCDSLMPWGKSEKITENKHYYVCHAELNAILNSESRNLKGAVIYVTLFPCNECAKAIIQTGISCVIYEEKNAGDVEGFEAVMKIFNLAGVEVIKRKKSGKEIKIKL